MKEITVIGGGTGTYVVLSGLKNHRLNLGVIVSMMDSGGSTGRLRDQLGVLPPGDLRQALLALSEASLVWRKLFLYRFGNGDLAGHNFGNLFLSVLEKVSKNYGDVVKTASMLLKTKGEVLPVTFDKSNLVVEYENGNRVKGEGIIDKNYSEVTRVMKALLEPAAEANPSAIKRIYESDCIIVGPGDIYTSIVPVFLVNGIREAFNKTKAKIFFIMNLMTKAGQTTNYRASDHLRDFEKFSGRSPDVVVINDGKVSGAIVSWYESQHEHLVENDLTRDIFDGEVILADVVDRNKFEFSGSEKFVDPRVRSILRHSSRKLAGILLDRII